MVKKYSVFIYWLIMLVFLFLFFTNDFGILDLQKTSIVIAVGLDKEDEKNIKVTAQVAVPKPSESGDSITYVEVDGSGENVADALNEINAKTGFYPKLLFCDLILLGESCLDDDIFRFLDYFYRNNSLELTSLVACCKGEAAEALGQKTETSNSSAVSIKRILSDELKKSANVSTVNLKTIAQAQHSKSQSCYMPLVEFAPQQGASQNSASGGGSSGGSGGGGASGQSEGGGEDKPVDYTCQKTAFFKNGRYMGVLDKEQAFALNILKNEIRLAVACCDVLYEHYCVGLKNTSGGLKLKVKDGEPVLQLAFSAYGQIRDVSKASEPEEPDDIEAVPEEVLKGTEDIIKEYMGQLVDASRETDCDFLGVRDLLYKFNNKHFDELNDDILQRMQIEYDIKIRSVN